MHNNAEPVKFDCAGFVKFENETELIQAHLNLKSYESYSYVSMAVVAVPFILYLVRFCSSKSCTRKKSYSYSTRFDLELRGCPL